MARRTRATAMKVSTVARSTAVTLSSVLRILSTLRAELVFQNFQNFHVFFLALFFCLPDFPVFFPEDVKFYFPDIFTLEAFHKSKWNAFRTSIQTSKNSIFWGEKIADDSGTNFKQFVPKKLGAAGPKGMSTPKGLSEKPKKKKTI